MQNALFFGIEVIAPWPEKLPSGRLLLEGDRHLTLAFLGSGEKMEELLSQCPLPPFSLGLAALFDYPLFLPKHTPRVAAWHVQWLEGEEKMVFFQKELTAWLKREGLHPKERKEESPLFHVTLARQPFSVADWKESFQPIPLYLGDLHLFESLGHSRYKRLWSRKMMAPFVEREHTADLAYLIRGEDLAQLHLHAQLAMSFHFPSLLSFFSQEPIDTFDALVGSLNQLIARVDEEIGSPFKAVSYHGTIEKRDTLLEWEMIVDV